MIRDVLTLLGKDLRVEWRNQELALATLFFAAVVMLIFVFAFLAGDRPSAEVCSGVLWVALALSGTVGIARGFEREREGSSFRALLLSPMAREVIYVSKLTGIALLMALVAVVALVLLVVLFGAMVGEIWPTLLLLLALGIVGFSAVAALFGAALGRAQSRQVLLPLLLYPLTLPVLIAGTRATALLLSGGDAAQISFWLRFLVVFDAVFVSLGVWLFEHVVTAGEA